MEHLPEPARVVQLPDGTYAYVQPSQLTPAQQQHAAPQIIHQHIHQAPPDRTLQRLTVGAGIGAGAIGAGLYAAPLLAGVLAVLTANLAMLVLLVAVTAWGVVTVVRSIGGADGEAAAKNVARVRRG